MGNTIPADSRTANLSPGLPAMQQLLTLAAGSRTHAEWHQAVIGPGRLCWPERPLYVAGQS